MKHFSCFCALSKYAFLNMTAICYRLDMVLRVYSFPSCFSFQFSLLQYILIHFFLEQNQCFLSDMLCFLTVIITVSNCYWFSYHYSRIIKWKIININHSAFQHLVTVLAMPLLNRPKFDFFFSTSHLDSSSFEKKLISDGEIYCTEISALLILNSVGSLVISYLPVSLSLDPSSFDESIGI